MDTKELRVGLLLQGGFARMAPHIGAMEKLIEWGLFKPSRIVGASGGALMALALCPWTVRQAKKVASVITTLSYWKIFTIPRETAVPAAATVLASTAPFWPFIEPETWSRKGRAIGRTVMMFAVGTAFTWFIKRLITAKSAFSNHPLYRLLRASFDFRRIIRSDVEVQVVMCGVPEGQNVVMSTHEEGITTEDILAASIGTSTIALYFQVANFRGQPVTDGEARTNYPVELLEDMDVIFRLSYYPPEPYPRWETMWDHFNVYWSIWAREHYHKEKREYEERRNADPNLPEVVEIMSSKKIPQLEVDDFSRSGLEHSINLGAQIMEENRELIERKLQEALERKRARFRKG